ncbi:hypothetical protein [Pseudonocardia abyssalis]|uniref:DoxX family protein n=1 Tax=Pseudonocardia abyssalis TaxID=2792008 RepID=A0ABS6UNL5_9PSEU|nr:hypothetical protein [Pseudonocardia abyssalis]MBW0119466.1 hypothetical protein [Pseudonocardia abyssalis]MBW0133804.1 hypothetical protein [Pseudonocardia abyssalis]
MSTLTTAPARPRRRNWPVVAIELFVAAGAVYGGVGLARGNTIGMLDEWLEGTPFTSWFVPGILLLLVVAVPMATAAVLELLRSPWAAAASITAGAAQIAWIGAQLAIMQRYNVQQPIILACGLAVVLLAVATCRHRPVLPSDGR